MMMKQLRSSCSADHPLARRAQLRLRLLLQRRTVCASPNKTALLSPVLAASQQGRITSIFLNKTRNFSATGMSEAELRTALALLAGWKPGRNYSDAENDAFWQAKQLVKSMVHPVTQEVMFLPGRMSAFVPVNAPTAMGMLLHGPTGPAAAAFWQFMNQRGNAMTNYVNRSGATVGTSALFMSFASACTVSVTVALGMGRLVARNPALKSLQEFSTFIEKQSFSVPQLCVLSDLEVLDVQTVTTESPERPRYLTSTDGHITGYATSLPQARARLKLLWLVLLLVAKIPHISVP
ncbi:unnamed protein product [Amoebophrya sp. A120]|nr:unnamed protein product [Amoebophrya sp. A120]|eukprot:GSA120T00006003001.1